MSPSEPTVPRVELCDVSVAFDGDVVLSEVTLSVAPGEIVALLGPSGCGKTTLLRAVAGLAPLRSGTVSFDGFDIASVATHKRELGLMFRIMRCSPISTLPGMWPSA